MILKYSMLTATLTRSSAACWVVDQTDGMRDSAASDGKSERIGEAESGRRRAGMKSREKKPTAEAGYMRESFI